jgi:3-oxoadipate enol-lactonase
MNAHSTDRYITADGARLRYRDEGSGLAVMLVHGWTLDLEMWNPLTAALRADFRVVRLDRRGFGMSSGHPGPERDIADVDALCRHLALERVTLIGMSQGARAVLGFASIAPGRVACLVLDGPPDVGRGAVAGHAAGITAGDATGDDDVPLAQYRALVRHHGIEAFRREWATHPLIQLRTADRNARRLLSAILRRYPGNDLLAAAGAGAVRAEVDLASLAMPALVISGEYDLAGRVQVADLLATRLPNAERAMIPDAGHLPNLDNPVAYHSVVRWFLNRHAGAAT